VTQIADYFADQTGQLGLWDTLQIIHYGPRTVHTPSPELGSVTAGSGRASTNHMAFYSKAEGIQWVTDLLRSTLMAAAVLAAAFSTETDRKLNDVNGEKHAASLRHPARRDGAVAAVLFLLPAFIGLALVFLHRPMDVATVTVLVTAAVGLPVAWLTWAVYRDARQSTVPVSELTTVEAANQLARAVGAQWNDEAAVRRLNDPWPLPVSWIPADTSLTDSWDSLVKLATSGAGWPTPAPADRWADGPDELTGKGSELVEVLARVPTGRLVVLGEPGAGKTMLMVQLVLDLLARRADGDPVPFLASAASWNPAEQGLRDWLAALLMISHPALAAAPPAGVKGPTQAAALIASGLIVPILDGLDEIPDEVRGSAISQINDALRPGEQLVVTCRSQQYQDAVRPERGIEVNLRGAVAVQLNPLSLDTVSAYLCDDASGPVAQSRWGRVLDVLGADKPAGQALQVPLMVGLARTIYNPRPGELAGALRDPAELCDPALADRAAVESLLFDGFIPAAYRHDPAGPWNAQNAEGWLVFLAGHLEYTIHGPDLAWWQLPLAQGAPSRRWIRIMLRAAGWFFGDLQPPLVGLGTSAVFALGLSMSDLVSGVRLRVVNPSYIGSAASPTAGLARDHRAAIVAGTRAGVTAGIVFGAIVGVMAAIFRGIIAGVEAAAAAAVVVGIVFSVVGTFSRAWPWFQMARIWLALNHHLPWPLMDFLIDAHKRGVLRQAGAVYQFRHIELQHRLATKAGLPPQVSERVLAEILRTALNHMKQGQLTVDEEAAAVAALRDRAAGRTDLLAQVAGLLEGVFEGDVHEPEARLVAMLCRKAGADAEAIPGWIEEGRRQRASADLSPFSGGRRPLPAPTRQGPSTSSAHRSHPLEVVRTTTARHHRQTAGTEEELLSQQSKLAL
jgi:NACHT domain